MRNMLALTRRNTALFLRDRATVFFSFLSSLIIIALYVLFIANMYTSGLMEDKHVAAAFGKKAIDFTVYLQMIAGILIINSLSLSIGSFSTIAKDFETRRIDSFRLTPATVAELTLAYLTSGFLVSFVLNIFTWLVSSVLIGVLTGYTVAAVTHFAVVGVLAFVSFVSCAIMIMLTSLVKSSAALGVMTGLSGTFLGFLCGIYMPYSSLGKGMEVAGSVLPFTHLTIWLKHIVLGDAFRQLGVTGELEAAMNELFSANSTGFLGLNAPLWMMELYAAAFAVICLATAWALIQRRAAHRPRGSRAA